MELLNVIWDVVIVSGLVKICVVEVWNGVYVKIIICRCLMLEVVFLNVKDIYFFDDFGLKFVGDFF